MENLNEAVIKMINEDVAGARKEVQNELYARLGTLLEEKLKEFAPTIFSEAKLVGNQAKLDRNNNKKLDKEDFAMLRKNKMNENDENNDDDLIYENIESLAEELQQLVEDIENELGEELNENDIEELADILLESLEKNPDEEEEEYEDEEDLEEDLEEDTDE